MLSTRSAFATALIVMEWMAGATSAYGAPPPELAVALEKGSTWRLELGDQLATMKILGGRTTRSDDGVWTQSLQVQWQGRVGELLAVSREGRKAASIEMKFSHLPWSKCNGSPTASGAFLIGTCTTSRRKAVWYASRLEQSSRRSEMSPCAPVTPSPRPKQEGKGPTAADEVNSSLPAPRRLSGTDARQAAIASVRNKKYAPVASQGSADSAQRLDLPQNPRQDESVYQFIVEVNARMFTAIETVYARETEQFDAAEQEECSGNLFCKLMFREALIHAILVAR
jgi:hypothetical protein